MAAPTSPLDRSKTVTTANPTPPTNVPVYYQGTPPFARPVTPHWVDEPQWTTAIPRGEFIDPFNGAVATQWTGTDALPVVAELAGKAEADGTEVMTVIGNTVCYGTGDPYTESPNSDHPSSSASVSPELLIFIDFVNNTATNNGATVAISTLFSTFNPEGLVPGQGYILATLDYSGDALAAVLGSFTCRIQYLWNAGAVQGDAIDNTFFIRDATNSYALQLTLDFPNTRARFQGYNEVDFIMDPAPLNDGTEADAYNVAAFTLTTVADGGRIEFAVNGSAVTSGTYGTVDRPVSDPFTSATTDMEGLLIQSISIYAALPDTSGLSELSEV